MSIIEILFGIKKNIKNKCTTFYKNYFTIEGTYTSLLPDKIYLKKMYKSVFNKELNLKNPETFNEKLQWMKLYDRRPLYTTLVDKYLAREYVKEKVGEKYLIPLLGVWDSPYEIDFDSLPNQFVLKCNHESDVFICEDKENIKIKDKKQSFDSFDEVREALQRRLKINFYKSSREWPYKNVKRKIICEEYMKDKDTDYLLDYKFFCFNGKVKALYVASGRFSDTRFDFFDRDFNHLSIVNAHLNSETPIPKPERLKEMIDVAEKLSADIPNVRIDLYQINGRVYFSEFTFFHMSGFYPFVPDKWDKIFGDYFIIKGDEKN